MIPFGDPSWYQHWRSPYYNDSHKRFRAVMREFVEKEIIPFCFDWDENKVYPKGVVKKLGDLNLLAAAVSPKIPVRLPYRVNLE